MQTTRSGWATVLVFGVCLGIGRGAAGDTAVPAGSLVEGEAGAKIDEYLSRLAGFGFNGVAIVE